MPLVPNAPRPRWKYSGNPQVPHLVAFRRLDERVVVDEHQPPLFRTKRGSLGTAVLGLLGGAPVGLVDHELDDLAGPALELEPSGLVCYAAKSFHFSVSALRVVRRDLEFLSDCRWPPLVAEAVHRDEPASKILGLGEELSEGSARRRMLTWVLARLFAAAELRLGAVVLVDAQAAWPSASLAIKSEAMVDDPLSYLHHRIQLS